MPLASLRLCRLSIVCNIPLVLPHCVPVTPQSGLCRNPSAQFRTGQRRLDYRHVLPRKTPKQAVLFRHLCDRVLKRRGGAGQLRRSE